jgi:hypothetical protein
MRNGVSRVALFWLKETKKEEGGRRKKRGQPVHFELELGTGC